MTFSGVLSADVVECPSLTSEFWNKQGGRLRYRLITDDMSRLEIFHMYTCLVPVTLDEDVDEQSRVTVETEPGPGPVGVPYTEIDLTDVEPMIPPTICPKMSDEDNAMNIFQSIAITIEKSPGYKDWRGHGLLRRFLETIGWHYKDFFTADQVRTMLQPDASVDEESLKLIKFRFGETGEESNMTILEFFETMKLIA